MNMRWYIVHAYSNFEKKVAESIREQAAQRGLEDKFVEIMVPTEQVVEIRRGRKINSERKFFPGYVLVKCDLTDDVYHLIKNTPKVTGFLGADKKPMPIQTPRPSGSKVRSPTRSSGRRRRSASRSARTCASPTARSPGLTASSRKSTSSARGSRSPCRSSAARPRSTSNTARSRKCDRAGVTNALDAAYR